MTKSSHMSIIFSGKNVKLTLIVLGLMMAGMFMRPERAYADCGVQSENIHDYAGTFVELYWRPYGAAGLTQANNGTGLGVNITTRNDADAPMTPGGNIVQLSGNTVVKRRVSASFGLRLTGVPGGGANCTTAVNDNIVVVLGRGITSWPFDDTGTQSWALDCDMSIHPNQPQRFDIVGLGVPAGARSGGWWDRVTIDPANGFTEPYALVYHEPPPDVSGDAPTINISASCRLQRITIAFRDPDMSTTVNRGMRVTYYVYYGNDPSENRIVDERNIWLDDNGPPPNDDPLDKTVLATIDMSSFNPNRTYHIGAATNGYGDPILALAEDTYGPCDINPTGSVDATCSTVSGRVRDRNTGEALRVALYRDARMPSPSVGPSSSDPGYHGVQTTDSDRNYSFSVSRYSDYRSHTYRLYARNINTSGNVAGWVLISAETVEPCAEPSCSLDVSPGDPEPDDNFSVGVTITYSPGSSGANLTDAGSDLRVTVTNNADSNVIYNSALAFPTLPPSPLDVSTGNIVAQVGSYTVRARMTGQVSFSCTQQMLSAYKPYLAVYGGDVIAGGSLDNGSGCSAAASSPILTFLRGAGRGAGTQLAAFATGAITDFASAKLRSSGTPTRPDGLKFANTPSMGSFGGSNCVMGYAIPASADNTISVSSVDISTLSGKYRRSGNLTITGGSIANGRKVVVWVDGNLTITGPMINYAGSGGWSNVNQIPSLYVIASGNIYIDNDVTDLDGVYVAHGTINTCTNGSSQYAANANFYANCNTQLVVHGSLVANTIKWLRTYGTLRDASAGEHPYGGTDPKAGELIISGPEMYLAEPGLPIITGSGPGTQFQAITSLPPVL